MPWVAGQSGNPTGRRPESIEVKEVRRLAQAKTMDAYKVIEGLMTGAEKDTVRLAAAIAILKIAGLKFDSAVDEEKAPAQRQNPPPSRSLADGLAPQAPIN